MRAPIYLNVYFSETKKQQKTATQNMKHTTYLFSFVAVTNFRKCMDCFGLDWIVLKRTSIVLTQCTPASVPIENGTAFMNFISYHVNDTAIQTL